MSGEFRILTTNVFDKLFEKLSKNEKIRIIKLKDSLKKNPFSGKPLGYSFFREKKIEGNRLYYLIYDKKLVILFVFYSNKKMQQKTIDQIKLDLEKYKFFVEKI
jgi:putative component of toxin-antitoxin plasmid stabilization module